MPALSFNHFNLRADRELVDQLRDFYVDVVGLKVGPRPSFNFNGYWLYLGDLAVLHLVEAPDAPGAGHTRHGSFDHVAFSCSGLANFEEHFRRTGVNFRRTPVPGTDIVQLFVQDPAGNGVELNFAGGDARSA
jgi:catechol-2,3-dioxygenase